MAGGVGNAAEAGCGRFPAAALGHESTSCSKSHADPAEAFARLPKKGASSNSREPVKALDAHDATYTAAMLVHQVRKPYNAHGLSTGV